MRKNAYIIFGFIFLICVIAILAYEKFYLGPREVLATIKLPTPIFESDTSIEEALNHRRSVRQYKDEPLTLQQVEQLLWAAQGITSGRGFRTAPSAGGLYPLEIYVFVGNVKQLDPGLYHYVPKNNSLEKLAEGDKREQLAKVALDQNSVRYGAIDIVITGEYSRMTPRYGARGERYTILEGGHAAENICLQAVSLHLGTVPVGAFNDDTLRRMLNTRTRAPLYILPVGKI